MKKLLLTTACLLALGGHAHADNIDPKRCDQEWFNAPANIKKFCAAREEAELKKNRREWELQSRNEVPKTKPVAPAAVALVHQANALLKGDPTCSQVRRASKLLERGWQCVQQQQRQGSRRRYAANPSAKGCLARRSSRER
jgi:hypothetical protein